MVLIGVRGGLLVDPYDDAFEKLAREKQTYFVPDILDGIFGNSRFLADRVHPNNQGHQLMADRIGSVFAKAIQEM